MAIYESEVVDFRRINYTHSEVKTTQAYSGYAMVSSWAGIEIGSKMSKRVLRLFEGLQEKRTDLAEFTGFSEAMIEGLKPVLVENQFISESGKLRSKGRNFLETLKHQEELILRERQKQQQRVKTAVLLVSEDSCAKLNISDDLTVLDHNIEMFRHLGFDRIYLFTNDQHLYGSKYYRLITVKNSGPLIQQFVNWIHEQSNIDAFMVVSGGLLIESKLVDALNDTDSLPVVARNRENAHLLRAVKADRSFFNPELEVSSFGEAIRLNMRSEVTVIDLSPRSIRGVSPKTVNKRYKKMLKREAQYNHIKAQTLVSRLTNHQEVESSERLGGFTNQSYHIEVNGMDLVARIPGTFTQDFVNRRDEDENSILMSLLGINSSHIYFNRDDGSKVNGYISNARPYSVKLLKETKQVKKAAKLLRKLHTSGIKFVNDFNWQQKLASIEDHIRQHQAASPDDYEATKAQVVKLYERIEDPSLIACHGDTLCENFVMDEKTGRLFQVDWKYAGNNHPAWDLATLVVDSQMSKKHRELFFETYGDISQQDVEIFIVIQDFLWSIWGLMKDCQGMDFYDYYTLRYQRAKAYLAKLED